MKSVNRHIGKVLRRLGFEICRVASKTADTTKGGDEEDDRKGNDVPREFGFFTLDVDEYDHFVLQKVLSRYGPSLVCVEINEKIPAPAKLISNLFAEGTYVCSL